MGLNKESDQTKYIRDLCIEYEEHLLFETDGVKQCIIVECNVKGWRYVYVFYMKSS